MTWKAVDATDSEMVAYETGYQEGGRNRDADWAHEIYEATDVTIDTPQELVAYLRRVRDEAQAATWDAWESKVRELEAEIERLRGRSPMPNISAAHAQRILSRPTSSTIRVDDDVVPVAPNEPCHCGAPAAAVSDAPMYETLGPAAAALCETCLPLRCDVYPGSCAL